MVKWLLMGDDHLQEVVAMRELTVVFFFNECTSKWESKWKFKDAFPWENPRVGF